MNCRSHLGALFVLVLLVIATNDALCETSASNTSSLVSVVGEIQPESKFDTSFVAGYFDGHTVNCAPKRSFAYNGSYEGAIEIYSPFYEDYENSKMVVKGENVGDEICQSAVSFEEQGHIAVLGKKRLWICPTESLFDPVHNGIDIDNSGLGCQKFDKQNSAQKFNPKAIRVPGVQEGEDFLVVSEFIPHGTDPTQDYSALRIFSCTTTGCIERARNIGGVNDPTYSGAAFGLEMVSLGSMLSSDGITLRSVLAVSDPNQGQYGLLGAVGMIYLFNLQELPTTLTTQLNPKAYIYGPAFGGIADELFGHAMAAVEHDGVTRLLVSAPYANTGDSDLNLDCQACGKVDEFVLSSVAGEVLVEKGRTWFGNRPQDRFGFELAAQEVSQGGDASWDDEALYMISTFGSGVYNGMAQVILIDGDVEVASPVPGQSNFTTAFGEGMVVQTLASEDYGVPNPSSGDAIPKEYLEIINPHYGGFIETAMFGGSDERFNANDDNLNGFYETKIFAFSDWNLTELAASTGNRGVVAIHPPCNGNVKYSNGVAARVPVLNVSKAESGSDVKIFLEKKDSTGEQIYGLPAILFVGQETAGAPADPMVDVLGLPQVSADVNCKIHVAADPVNFVPALIDAINFSTTIQFATGKEIKISNPNPGMSFVLQALVPSPTFDSWSVSNAVSVRVE